MMSFMLHSMIHYLPCLQLSCGFFYRKMKQYTYVIFFELNCCIAQKFKAELLCRMTEIIIVFQNNTLHHWRLKFTKQKTSVIPVFSTSPKLKFPKQKTTVCPVFFYLSQKCVM